MRKVLVIAVLLLEASGVALAGAKAAALPNISRRHMLGLFGAGALVLAAGKVKANDAPKTTAESDRLQRRVDLRQRVLDARDRKILFTSRAAPLRGHSDGFKRERTQRHLTREITALKPDRAER
jgi:hypothetical protein